MTNIPTFPGFWINLFTIGIVRARWVSAVNKQLGKGGAGFWFAWLLSPFANYGITGRLNEALAAASSRAGLRRCLRLTIRT